MSNFQARIIYSIKSIVEVINSTIDNDLQNQAPYHLLLIGDIGTTQVISDILIDIFDFASPRTNSTNTVPGLSRCILPIELHISTLTVPDFIYTQFDRYYHLGCFIDPNLLDFDSIKSTRTTSKENVTIATRLRDLFARQSLIFTTSTQVAENKYPSLGYQSLNRDIELGIQCWQFNLFDYKSTPDWLNARFWANPENFDKYRW